MYRYIPIKDVTVANEYQIVFTYENGEKRQFDMKPYLNKGIFIELNDPQMFETVRPSLNSVTWANNADMDPEVLFAESVKID